MNKLPLIQKVSHRGMRFTRRWEDARYLSYFAFLFIVIVVFFVLAFRLFQLTIVKGEYYHRLSEENRIKEILIEPKRGTILDRHGVTVVENTTPDPKKDTLRLSSKRVYHDGVAIAPLVGYRQIADKNDFENDPCLNKVQLGDKVGKKGVEAVYDCDLRGRLGRKLIELDARGKYQKTLNILPPQDGKTIQLALDLAVQKKAAELMNGKKGAVIVLKPSTGEILALYSSPSYNPQDFEDNIQASVEAYLTSSDKPLFNRATEGVYPPGSTFKLFVATGGLETHTIDEKTQFEDKGIIKLGEASFGNWYYLEYGKTESDVNVVKAIRRSTDTFFYQLGEKMGPEKIKSWAYRFGLGSTIDFPFEQSEGTLPSPFWKKELLKENWFTGDTFNMSIGQGYTLITPLQLSLATSSFANGGKLCKPSLLKDQVRGCKSLGISQKTLSTVREGMKEACTAGGTGYPLFDFAYRSDPTSSSSAMIKVQTACKTGTAEAAAGEARSPHAWITAFAPFDKPQVVVTVLVENSGQGSDIAGPIARDVLKAYFEENK